MARILRLLAFGALLTTQSTLAAGIPEGRWQGVIEIPGRPVDATLDIARNSAHQWIGSTDLAQLKLRGAVLEDIKADGDDFSAVLANDLGGPGEAKASYTARMGSDGALHGEFHQAGNSAPFVFKPAGVAQVQLPRPRGVVPKALEGSWTGDFIGAGNYSRHVTVTLSNPDATGSQATLVSVGKRTFEAPISWLGYGDGYLELESPTGVNYEGKLSADGRHFAGTVSVGSDEFKLDLEHAP